jgi:signal transduction histidine kinase
VAPQGKGNDSPFWHELGERDQEQLGRIVDLGLQVAALIHELRQPLALLKGYAQLLVDRAGADAALRESATLMVEQVDRMDRLVARTREYARGRPGVVATRAEVSPAIADALAMLGFPERTPRLSIRSSLPAGLPPAAADPLLVQQIIYNLLANARDALTGREGSVVLSGGEEGDQVFVRVQDDGPGIPAATQARLFTPFVSSKPEGTGLGLWLCRDLAQRAGGSLRLVESERGACFELRLPRASD